MLFGATLKKNSPIFRNWRAQSLLIGNLEGVPFRWTGVDYVVDQIPDFAVNALLAHNNVTVHIIALASEPVAAEEPEVTETDEETDTQATPKPRGRPRKS